VRFHLASLSKEAVPVLLMRGSVALSPETADELDIEVAQGVIRNIGPDLPISSDTIKLDLQGRMILPGLINAHDHLEFGIFPRLGRGPYPDARAWALDIYHPEETPIRERLQIAKATRLFWGGLKNLLSGVTSVCHHNQYLPQVFDSPFPVRVMSEYGWSHSLDFSKEVRSEHQATPAHAPYVIHLAEGTSERSRHELSDLDQKGMLNSQTVLVHGVALKKEDLELVRQRGSGLVWCPSSNLFILGKTLDLEDLRCGPAVALGNDSPLTADGDLLDEIQLTCRLGASPRDIYPMVTNTAATILKLKQGEGSIVAGGLADLLVVRNNDSSPADRLVSLRRNDIEMVLTGGSITLSSQEFARHLPQARLSQMQLINYDGLKYWVAFDVLSYLNETVRYLGDELVIAGKRLGV